MYRDCFLAWMELTDGQWTLSSVANRAFPEAALLVIGTKHVFEGAGQPGDHQVRNVYNVYTNSVAIFCNAVS